MVTEDTAALQTLYGYPNFTTASVVVTGKETGDDSITVSSESRSRPHHGASHVCIQTRTSARKQSATLTRYTFMAVFVF